MSEGGDAGKIPSIAARSSAVGVHAAAAAALARTGRVFDLGYTLGASRPQIGLGGRINAVHLMSMTRAAYERYRDELQAELATLMWSHPSITHSWYKASDGKV